MSNKPRVGFLSTGWVGRHRMAAMIGSGAVAEMVAAAFFIIPAKAGIQTRRFW